LKTQVVIDADTQQIISLDHARGATHDFTLFKQSRLPIHPQHEVWLDSGYQGVQRLDPQAQIPKKKTKKEPLTRENKAHNRALSRKRIVVENIIGDIKVFRVLSDRYRGRANGRFSRRWHLLAAIHNLNLSTPLNSAKGVSP
jgi:transposase